MQNIDKVTYYNRPFLFYFLSTLTSWVAWFASAWLSHQDIVGNSYSEISGPLMLVGLISPTVIAFTMMRANPNIRNDFFSRIFSLSGVKPLYLMLACCLMPSSIILAQGISLILGYNIDQFSLSHSASFTYSLFPAWVLLLLAPAVEELAWHSYGTDCLRAKLNLFNTSLLFSVFWILWHFPLSFIKGYYHSNIAEEGLIYSLNFAFSLFPFVLLMNWLYYKTNRSISVAILFHITAGVFNEIFHTHPDSKLIQTVLLTILTFIIVYKDPQFFFSKIGKN